jgi:Mg2+ and Co2+ transporter CorA
MAGQSSRDRLWIGSHLDLPQEARVINTNNVALTYELHVIRAHLLHYKSLLRDLRKSVEFVRGTVNPAMESDDIDDAVRNSDNELLERECENIFLEVDRLTLSRQTLDDRVQNVQNLVGHESKSTFMLQMTKIKVYATINIDDSRAMKRLSYITMIFLPATFLAVGQLSSSDGCILIL